MLCDRVRGHTEWSSVSRQAREDRFHLNAIATRSLTDLNTARSGLASWKLRDPLSLVIVVSRRGGSVGDRERRREGSSRSKEVHVA